MTRDLVLELERVVGADLGAEPVLERGDDAAAVGVVLGVGAGDDEHVERQPQHVAADLDVALLHHVEHRTWMRSARSGSSLMATMPRCAARDQAVVDGLRVAEACGPRPPSSGRRRRSGRPTLVSGVASFSAYRSSAVPPGDRQVVAELGGAAARLGRDRVVRVLAELGSRRSPASTRRAGRPGCAAAGSCPGRARRAARRRARRAGRAPAAGARCRRSRGCPATGRGPRPARPAGFRGFPALTPRSR